MCVWRELGYDSASCTVPYSVILYSGASCNRAGAEDSGGCGHDGGGVGGGNDLGGGLGEGAVQGLRPGRRIAGLGVIGVL